jgi:uncharacterized circularly permuted ATP-grasp superfamily protein/uncharacterized alpha-E superfamily protein
MLEEQSTTGEAGTAHSAGRQTPSLLADYQRTPPAFDELLTEEGQVRPHYANLVATLGELSPAELHRRSHSCRQLVHEQGITYHVYGDPRGHERLWQLDPLPLIILSEEWRKLEAGLIQRAMLLNRILSDCYCSQELIRSGWLSPALVFGHPDFLRPCHNARPADDVFLHFFAADLARSPDGQWWVISDRTQIPTGAGYALANRLIISRILPESFRDHRIHRLASFFRAAQDLLTTLGSHLKDRGHTVILTPGPHNETYFEQAYLARYLGYMLVEGQDLSVRDNRVFLKTLSGLEQVNVILRRVDDDFCDPLELRNDSMLGVPGLVEASRAGHVVVANALGSGLVESPALIPFLPELCRHLLGEDLKLPSVATWWCGQEKARQYALEHLDQLLVKSAFRRRAAEQDAERSPAIAPRDRLRQRIEFDPDLFVAQERVEFSTAPSWHGKRLAALPFSLRVYLVADGHGSYRVMPGGLTRVSPASGERSISMQRGGTSKDTWIVSEAPVEEVTLLDSKEHSLELRRTGNNLPSRLADNFFWLGRYSERADATARILRSALVRFNPEQTASALPMLVPLVQTLEVQGQFPNALDNTELRQNAEAFEAELLAAILDPARADSLRQIADQMQHLGMLVRDRTSNDMWRVLSHLNDLLDKPPARSVLLAGDAVEMLNQTLIALAAFHGLARENMTRAQAWRFLDMGLRIERAIYLGRLLEATLLSPEAENPSTLEVVLEVADSSITYRSRYTLLQQVAPVFDLVLLDDKNPRSVLFQIRQLIKHFEHLPAQSEPAGPVAGRRILQGCLASLAATDPRELAGPRERWPATKVSRAIQEVLRELPRLSNTIAAGYFAHSEISRTGRETGP